MEIGPLSNNEMMGRLRPAGKSAGQPAPDQTEDHADRIEISEDARQKLAELADSHLREIKATGVTFEGSSERVGKIERIKARIETGFYDIPEVKEKIAEKIIRRNIENPEEPGTIE